jgi:phage/plasmid primase-like uncharacterized protein
LSLDRGVIEYIKQVVDPMLIISSLGIPIARQQGNQARGPCPIHGGDNKSAFAVDLDTGRWRCFSHECHVGHSDIIGLVQLSRRCSFIEAIKFTAALMGIDLSGGNFAEEATQALHKKQVLDFTRAQDRRKV